MELYQQTLSTAEGPQGPFVINEMLGRLATTYSQQESDDLFRGIVDTIQLPDLQAEKIVLLQCQKEAKLAELMEDPYSSLVAEVQLLSRLYENRSIVERRSNEVITTFVTRTQDLTDVDNVFKITEREGEAPRITIETCLQKSLETPCRITACNGGVTVSVEAYKSGLTYDRGLLMHEDQRAEALLKAVFANTLWASSVSFSRTPDEVAASDRHARTLLIAHREKQRSV